MAGGNLMARNYSSSSDHSEVNVSAAQTLPISMWAWCKPDNDSGSHILLWVGDKDQTNYFLGMWLAGNLAGDPARAYHNFYTGGGAGIADSSNSYTPNVWNGVGALFLNNSSRTVYLNGTPTTNSDSGPGSPTGHDRTAIGWLADSSPSYSSGSDIAEAAIWNVELTPGEFAALQAGWSPKCIRPQNLIGPWSLLRTDACDNDPSLDMSATGSSYVDHPPIIYPTGSLFTPTVTAAPAVGHDHLLLLGVK